LGRCHFGQSGSMVHRTDWVTLEARDLNVRLLRGLFHLLPKRKREEIVAGEDRHPFQIWYGSEHKERQRYRHGVVRGQCSEQKLVALVVDFAGRSRWSQHRDFVTLGYSA